METNDHRTIAVQQFNHCWELLEKDDRSASEDANLITSAFASRYHWSLVGDSGRFVTADWMVSRAAAAIAEGDLAVRFALLAYERSLTSGTPDWLRASVAEGLARAYAAAGDIAERDNWWAEAEVLVSVISDAESRELIESQLRSVPR
jgi:hypothetical protein